MKSLITFYLRTPFFRITVLIRQFRNFWTCSYFANELSTHWVRAGDKIDGNKDYTCTVQEIWLIDQV